MRALICPRPGAEPGEHWYSFVAERTEAGTVPGLTGAEVRAPQEGDKDQAGCLVLVGHEQSTATIAEFLSSLPSGRAAAGTLLVAPPTSEADWRAAGHLRVLVSDDEAERGWAERHGAEVAIRPGGQSFYGEHEVAVLINLAALATEVAEAGPD
jgi:predicted alpha/beta hydrolase family esterase